MASTASTEQKKRDKTLVMGFWLDNVTNVHGLAQPSPVGTVANSVAKLVINKINNNFGLVPPLVLDDDMGVAWIPHVAANTDISTLDDRGLITLVQPNEQTSLRVKSRLEEFQRANASKAIVPTIIEQDSVAKLRDELLGQIGPLMKKVDSQGKEIDQLKISNTELKTLNDKLTSSNAKLTTSIDMLASSNGELTSKVNGLASLNADLLEKVRNLGAFKDVMSSALQSHSRRIHALNRRLVLDDARNKLAKDYNISLDEIRPRCSNVSALVQQVQSRLSTEDVNLLSYDALTMIFDSSDDSMRDGGNKAAHEASIEDRVDSVLEARLTNTQRALLREIYYFAHGKEPDFERAT